MKRIHVWLSAAALAVMALAPMYAQGVPTDSIPLRIQIVLSRFDGEKKLSSLPYTLTVNATKENSGRAGGVSMRMGVQVPIPSTIVSKEGGPPTQSFSYRDVGANIDCHALPLDDGRYRLHFSIHQSSVLPPADNVPSNLRYSAAPMFRNFNTSFVVALRDGQTAQNTSATDPVSGEVLKVEVTMNVVK